MDRLGRNANSWLPKKETTCTNARIRVCAIPKRRPAVRVARLNGVCGVATLANGTAIGCAPRLASVQPPNAPHAERPTGC